MSEQIPELSGNDPPRFFRPGSRNPASGRGDVQRMNRPYRIAISVKRVITVRDEPASTGFHEQVFSPRQSFREAAITAWQPSP
jgi:hypothetical protein